MKTTTVEITLTNGSTLTVKGYAVEFDFLPGYEFVVHKVQDLEFYTDFPRWQVTEKKTGSRVPGINPDNESFTKKDAIKQAEARLYSVTADQFEAVINRLTVKIAELKNSFNITPKDFT